MCTKFKAYGQCMLHSIITGAEHEPQNAIFSTRVEACRPTHMMLTIKAAGIKRCQHVV